MKQIMRVSSRSLHNYYGTSHVEPLGPPKKLYAEVAEKSKAARERLSERIASKVKFIPRKPNK